MSTAALLRERIRRLLRPLLALTLGFFALAAGSAAWADPPGRVGRIADTDGNVWLFDREDNAWVPAQRNRPVTQGDRLWLERGARATVQIGSGTLRLDGGTEVAFEQLDDARVHVRLLAGRAALRARSVHSAREFALVTREGRYEPLRPGHFRVDVEERSSVGEALAGAMRFEARDSVLDIAEGQRAEFWQERGVTHYSWAQPGSDRFGDWVARADRDDARERNRYVSEEMTGAEDLDRYGRWDRHPEYGAVWFPTVVVAGWAPYRYGHWAYVRPWGWTWVDDAPWGFAPFHYGRWVYYGGRWGWCPGQYVARPVYAPALVAWFGGPNVRVGVSIGGGPAVGWVPLAPRDIYYPAYVHSPNYVRIVNRTHERWHGPSPHYERPVPTGPVMYTNQGVPGGVTVVPQDVLRARQPISSKVVLPVDARTLTGWPPGAGDAPRGAIALPPPARIVAAPAVVPPPAAARDEHAGRIAPTTVPQVAPAVPPRLQGRPSHDPHPGDGGSHPQQRGDHRVATPAIPSPTPPAPAPERRWQRVEPPQVQPVPPTLVAPPPQTRPPPRSDDAQPQRPVGSMGQRAEERVWRGRDPREQLQLR